MFSPTSASVLCGKYRGIGPDHAAISGLFGPTVEVSIHHQFEGVEGLSSSTYIRSADKLLPCGRELDVHHGSHMAFLDVLRLVKISRVENITDIDVSREPHKGNTRYYML